jgi:hypothetical protein
VFEHLDLDELARGTVPHIEHERPDALGTDSTVSPELAGRDDAAAGHLADCTPQGHVVAFTAGHSTPPFTRQSRSSLIGAVNASTNATAAKSKYATTRAQHAIGTTHPERKSSGNRSVNVPRSAAPLESCPAV